MDFLGTKLATCSCDKTVRVFDVNINHGSQTFVAELKGHEGPVSGFTYFSSKNIHLVLKDIKTN